MSTHPPLYRLPAVLIAVSVIGATCVHGIYLQSNDTKLTTAASDVSTTTVSPNNDTKLTTTASSVSTTTFSPNTNEKSNKAVGLVHPTFITAIIDPSRPCKSDGKCHLILETRARAYRLTLSLGNISKGSLESTGTFKNPHNVQEKIVAKDSLGTIVTHKALAEFVKNGTGNKKNQSTNSDFNPICLNTLYRAFDRFESGGKHYFVGMVDQVSVCMGVYKSDTKMETGEVNSFSDLFKGLEGLYLRQLIEESEESIYKYSSIAAAVLDSSRLRLFLFDEAGGMISTIIPISYFETSGPTDTSIGTETSTYSMSAVQLADLKVEMPFVNKDISSSMESLIDKTGSNGKNGIQRMRSSFRLGFIESITFTSDKTLCWSSTMRKHKSKGINCLSLDKDEKVSKTLNGLLESFSKGSMQVLAMAVGESSIGSHYHVVYANLTGLNYLMCSVGLKVGSTNATKPGSNSVPVETTESQNCTQRQLREKSGIEHMIDIVQWKSPSCSNQKMVILYHYGYKVKEPQGDLFDEKSMIPAPWMTFFADAAMAKGDKFYFFSGGNILITMDLASSSKCPDTLEFSASSYREFQSSELIRIFGESLSSGPPVYLGYQEYDALSKSWTPDINDGPMRIDGYTSLTGIGSKGNEAAIALVLIIIIIITSLGCLFFHIFFGRHSGKSPSTKSIRPTSDVSSVNSAKSVRSVISPPGLSKAPSKKSPDLSLHKASRKSHSKKSSSKPNSKRSKKSKLSSISDKKSGSKSQAKSIHSGRDKLLKKKSKKSNKSKSPRSPATRPKAISLKRPT